jgi:hypothetical protein
MVLLLLQIQDQAVVEQVTFYLQALEVKAVLAW